LEEGGNGWNCPILAPIEMEWVSLTVWSEFPFLGIYVSDETKIAPKPFPR
jgi:hypothetical protein